jgi:hypothetical protein
MKPNRYKNKKQKNKFIDHTTKLLISQVEIADEYSYENAYVDELRNYWGINWRVNKFPLLPKKIITYGLYNRRQRKEKLAWRDQEFLDDYIFDLAKRLNENYGISKNDTITIFKRIVTHYKDEKYIEEKE